MATRSFIGKQLPNGHITGIYCHWDGYPDGVGTVLENHYTTQERVDALLVLGSLSQLGARLAPELGEVHTFENPVRGVTVAYHRDRGEEKAYPLEYESLSDMERNVGSDLGAEYAYVWMVDEWETISL
jgi:hypothetical protein